MKVVIISSWVNFWPSCAHGKGICGRRKFSAPPYYSQRAVFASLRAFFHWYLSRLCFIAIHKMAQCCDYHIVTGHWLARAHCVDAVAMACLSSVVRPIQRLYLNKAIYSCGNLWSLVQNNIPICRLFLVASFGFNSQIKFSNISKRLRVEMWLDTDQLDRKKRTRAADHSDQPDGVNIMWSVARFLCED